MVEERGIVLQVRDGFAEVDAHRGSGCGGCGEKGVCTTAALGSLFTRQHHRVWLRNSIDAAAGDVVVMGLRDDDALGLAASAYLVPVVAMLVGAGAGETVGQILATTSELPVILGAAIGLLLGLGLFRRYSARDGSPGERIVLLRKEPKPSRLVTLT